MNNSIITSIVLPRKLKEEIKEIVKAGYFKNVSDLLVTGARHEVDKYQPSRATLISRAAKKKVDEYYLKKAKGSRKKAADLMFEDFKKYEKEDPNFFRF